jgi:hypothetical protein
MMLLVLIDSRDSIQYQVQYQVVRVLQLMSPPRAFGSYILNTLRRSGEKEVRRGDLESGLDQ